VVSVLKVGKEIIWLIFFEIPWVVSRKISVKLKVSKKIICLILFNPIALYYFIAINYLLKALLFKSVFTQLNSDIKRYMKRKLDNYIGE
jgi:hypothetical protein